MLRFAIDTERSPRIATAMGVIAAFVAATSLIVVSPASAADPPVNDDLQNAKQVTASPFSDTVDIGAATVGANEPNPCSASKTVWYAITPTSTGYATVTATGSVVGGSRLTVFEGTPSDDTFLTCSVDSGSTEVDSTFLVTSGATYYVQAGGISGDLTFTADLPVAPVEPDLSVALTGASDPVALGATKSYTATVSDATAQATAVSLTTTLSGAPATVTSTSATQGSCSVSGSTIGCNLGVLGVGSSATVTFEVAPNAVGTLTATSVASSAETDANPANNTATASTTVNNALGCTIIGTAGNDTLTGTNGSDVICGLGGNDTINAGNGNDTVYGGPGDDTIDGGNGDDVLHGGDGNDILGGGNGSDTIYGDAGNDTSYGETLLGSLLYLFDNGDDTIYGGPGDDDLNGQNGNDILVDTQGTDTMSGGAGNDSINVQDATGGDTANGGLGNDTCAVDTGDTSTSC